MNQSDAAITAHYAKNGRDIWASLHGTPSEYSITWPMPAPRSRRRAGKSCHVALYGVLFDFNKGDPEARIRCAARTRAGDPGKGRKPETRRARHTDNVGGDAYNQKRSEARAQAVVAWLTQHGIAAGRLTATGYGKTRPVADNDSDRAAPRTAALRSPNWGARLNDLAPPLEKAFPVRRAHRAIRVKPSG